MITLERLRKDLTMTPEDVRRVVTPELRHLMSVTPNAGFSVPSGHAFQCVYCEAIGMPSFYEVLKETVGPGLGSRRTDVRRLKSTKGIVPIKDLDSEPEFSSHINFTKDGLVCDHCYDSV